MMDFDDLIAERPPTATQVVGVPYYWNVLAAAMVERILGKGLDEPLRDTHSRIIDQLDSRERAVPLKWDMPGKPVFSGRGF
jgi:hypothetical protein